MATTHNAISQDDIDTLWSFNHARPREIKECVHDTIASKAALYPTKTAVDAWDGRLSYDELDKLSTRFAHQLFRYGVGTEVVVPLCFEKSMWTVVAMLGVLKAGAAFALVDMNLPQNRIREMIRQCQPKVICSSVSGQELFKEEETPVHVVGPGLVQQQVVQDGSLISPYSDPERSMYVCFTSGSTGRPKGIVVTHSAFASACHHQAKGFCFDAQSRVFDFASYAFDVSVYNAMITLSIGATMCIPSEVQRKESLNETLRATGATIVALTPSTSRLLDPEQLPSLETLILSGEAVTEGDLARLARGRFGVLNAYGPAECTPMSTLNANAISPNISTSIGRGIGAVTWVVEPSDHTKLMPVGVPGELLLEGPILAREYMGEPEKTAASFISNPPWLLQGSSAWPGRSGRLYKTGDIVRMEADGNLTFIGRKDTQVKIRGQRLELAEVEYHVQQAMPSTALVAELVELGNQLDKSMLAIFLRGSADVYGGKHITHDLEIVNVSKKVEEKLSQALPSYMVPSLYLRLPSIPLSATGKTDRSLLRQMGSMISPQKLIELRGSYANGQQRQPQTNAEIRLRELWAAAFNVEADSLSIDDEFVLLGGDSITAIKLVGAARKAGFGLSVADIFRYPTISMQAVLKKSSMSPESGNSVQFSMIKSKQPTDHLVRDLASLCGLDNPSLVEDAYPCTPLQEGMFTLSRKKIGDYIFQAVLDIEPGVDVRQLVSAFEEVMQSAPIFRTRIVEHAELGLINVVCRDTTDWIEIQEDEIETYLDRDKATPMGLGDKLVRLALTHKKHKERMVLVWTMHHALYDGWSLQLTMKLIEDVFQGRISARSITERSNFGRFVQNFLERDEAEAVEYWRSYLSDGEIATFPQLPTMMMTPKANSTIEYMLPSKTMPGITVSTMIRSALGLLINHYTASQDVVYGIVVSGRNASLMGIEDILGPTIATIPLMIRLDKEQPVFEYLNRQQQSATDMIPYEQIGLQRLAKLGTQGRDACDFQTLLVIQPQEDELESESVIGQWQTTSTAEGFSTYAIVLECFLNSKGGIKARASFDARVIDAWRMKRLLQQLSTVIEKLASATKSCRVRDVKAFGAEDEAIVAQWNSRRPILVEECVHELISQHATERPEAPAIVSWDGNLTHQKLDEWSTLLSFQLANLGVGPETFVPVCFEKSMFTIVAILGVLKAGGAFMLLDPSLPDDRLRYLCRQVGATTAVTSTACASRLCNIIDQGRTIAIDRKFFKLRRIESKKIRKATPNSPAYVIFTSGSTGEPKGVVIEHQSCCSAVASHHSMNMSASMRALQFSSYNFAGSIIEILMTLIHGGCVCVLSEEERGAQLAESIRRVNANWSFMTSTVLENLKPDDVPCLKTICVGGEPIKRAQVQLWSDRVHLRQTYGSAEQSGVVSSARLTDSSSPQDIGKATRERVWLVDASNVDELAPLGVPGEIVIEGPVVAREYIGQPDKTAAAMIRAPLWRSKFGPLEPLTRFYKTGDLGVYKEDGSISLLGRRDTQVKLRGQRIEAGEIEHQIKLASNEVVEVAVELATTSDSTRGPELVAFLVLRGGNSYSESTSDIIRTIQARLERLLPYYMVPSLLAPVVALPLTASRKIDRKRLREMGALISRDELVQLRRMAAGVKRAPRTEIERRISILWAQVLNLDSRSIGIDDSFFRLGGDSIAAMRLVGLARKAGLTLFAADIFRNPTLSSQAEACLITVSDSSDSSIPPFSLLHQEESLGKLREELADLCEVDPSRVEDAYPCTPLQEGLLSLTAKREGDYVKQSILRLSTDVNVERFYTAWVEVVESLPILRTRIVDHDKLGLVQVVCNDPFEWSDIRETLEEYKSNPDSKLMRLGGPLSRYALVTEGDEGKRYFVWTIHHALFDGWSLSLIMERVYKLYEAKESLTNKPVASLNSFLQYLVVGLQDVDTDIYWQKYLADDTFALFPPLPSDVQEPAVDAVLEIKLPSILKANITTTPSILIRAALGLLISQYSGSSDVIIGATLSGRNAPIAGIEELIAPTIATVPIRIKVSRDVSVVELLETLQEEATEMIAHEQTGLQRIAKINDDGRNACRFQTLLVVHTGEEEDLDKEDIFGTWQTSADESSFATYAITIECFITQDGGISIRTSYDTRIVDSWKMGRMLEHLGTLIQRLANSKPEQTVKDICDVSSNASAVLSTWNQTESQLLVEKCIHDLIASHAQDHPDAPAVKAWDGDLTRRDLDEHSTRLAHKLTDLGVGPEIIVPVCFEKSKWTVVAMLSVLKAGGAFVLLDPGLPDTRIQTLCKKVKAIAALTSTSCKTRLAQFVDNPIAVNSELLERLVTSEYRQKIATTPSNAAYIIFTSGSTGEPKGVIIEHRAYCSAAIRHGSVMNMNAETRALQFGSYNFAGAIMEQLMTLIYGGCVCIPSEEQRGTQLSRAIQTLGANWAFLTSTTLANLDPEAVPSLRTICIGGEPIRAAQIRQWAATPDRMLRQTYGSAETAAVVSSSHLGISSSTRDVGKPTAGNYWIVDPLDHDQLLPIGAPGEVIIEGPTIGREYLEDSLKSAAAFITTPSWRSGFGHLQKGSKFYKTGDLAAYTEDGSIELLGRKDMQVKLRGQRIEIGEIEYQARLASPDIKQAVVELAHIHDTATQGPQLVGFLVIESQLENIGYAVFQEHGDGLELDQSVIKIIRNTQTWLESRLPHFMVPSILFPISKLPLTISGKTDRRRLKQMASELSVKELQIIRAATWGQKRTPRTKAESSLRDMWSQVLNLDPNDIGLDDSFFRLGGDSISAMKLVGLAHKHTVNLTVSDVFRQPVLAAQAKILSEPVHSLLNEPIAPFSLLRGYTSESSLLQDLSSLCDMDEALIEDAYPCTPLQEGLLSLTSKRVGDYVMQAVLELHEEVDEGILMSAWELLVTSNPIYRTHIVQHSTLGLMQVVCKETIEWKRAPNLDEYLEEDKSLPMGLGDRLSRFCIVGSDGRQPRFLVWTVHHAAYDGWSFPLSVEQVSKAYAGFPPGATAGFNSFVKQTLDKDHGEVESYWRTQMANPDFMPFPQLPASKSEPRADKILEDSFPTPQKTEVTTSTILRGALAIVLGQYTNSQDVIFGATVSGRNAPVQGIDSIIGPTIATVPVRIKVPSSSTVQEYLHQIQRQSTEMIAYEQSGLHRIARLDENCRTGCSFQTLLAVQPEDNSSTEDTIGSWRTALDQEGFVTYAIALECMLGTDNVRVKANFDSSIVSEWQVKQLILQLGIVVEQLTTKNDKTVQSLNTLSAEDEAQIWSWNKDVPTAVENCLHDLIREHIHTRPEAIALCSENAEISYAQLDTLSTRLSSHISKHRSMTSGAAMVIPLYFNKSIWAIVAILGVLKAGGAFVLVDPSLPATRREYIINQAGGFGLVLSSAQEADNIMANNREVFRVDSDTLLALPNGEYSENRISPESPAYVIFTSGSTGKPKGVVVSHRAASTGCSHHGRAIGFGSNTRTLQFSSYAFDACIMEILTTLLFGGCVCMPQTQLSDIDHTIRCLDVNTAILTPGVARLLQPDSIRRLQTIVLCGEKPTDKDIQMFSIVARAYNGYGPAECTVCCSISTIDTNVESQCIGYAVGSVSWIVSPEDHKNLLPIGAIGELLIEGHILADGYLDDSRKTAEAFVDAPDWLLRGNDHQEGRRGKLYKTGDLVRYNPDGKMVFIGRKDNQAKIRGQRLELAEVEYHVRECLGGSTSVAAEMIKLKDELEKTHLAIFISGDVSKAPYRENGVALQTLGEVADGVYLTKPGIDFEHDLSLRLPSYMVPTLYFNLSSIPRTASGKVDSKRLRALGSALSANDLAQGLTGSVIEKRQPSTSKEKLIHDIWANILHLPSNSIGIEDNFLHLGGDSVTAMMVVGEARKLGLHFGVADVLRQQNIHRLADIATIDLKADPSIIPRNELQGPVEQSFAQSRLWFLDQLYPESTQYLMPYAIRIRGSLHIDALSAAISTLENRHETLRTTFMSQNDVELQVIRPFQQKNLRVVEIPIGREELLNEILDTEQNTPFDLKNEVGWRVTLYRMGEHDHVLSIIMHHIISDGWSASILQRELSAFYSAALHGQDPLSRVSPLPINYRDYALWQKQQDQIDEYQQQLIYWTTQLENSQPAELFCDYPRPSTLSGQSEIQNIVIGDALFEDLQRFCKEKGVTPFIVLFSAFRATHYRLTGSKDATIGTANANRDKWQLKDLIGFFVNMQCLRVKINEEETFEDLVHQVDEVNQASLDNPDVPFEQVVAELKKRQNRDISRQPLVQMVFTLHSQKDLNNFKLEGLDTDNLHVALASRFDLEFHVTQEEHCFRGEVAFSTELFDGKTISNMLAVFHTMLKEGIRNPTTSIDNMVLTNENDLCALEGLNLLEVDHTDYPRESSIVDIFLQQVAANQHRIAVKDTKEELTYAELDRRSDVICNWLIQQSLPKEHLVGVYSHRSCWTIAAFLGILKANMAYLPLDSKLPAKRIEDILSGLNGQKIVLLGPDTQLPNVQVDDIDFMKLNNIKNMCTSKPLSTAGPSANSLAYTMFTSGSTGKPKGVMIEHRGVLRLVTKNRIVQALPAAPTMAHMGNISFDITTWEIYASLLNGGTIICIDHMTVLDNEALAETFSQEKINTAILTPAILKHCLSESPAMLKRLKLLLVGGDKPDGRDLLHAQQITNGKIVNAYGPTENTVISTLYWFQPTDYLHNGVPIGRAIDNSGAYVVDSHMCLVPLGVVGELLVTGDGLARGYTDHASNNNRFVSTVIGGKEVRAYRTGDYVRYRPLDGQLEFFGRIDGQVKVQGNRVELGEIESIMKRDSAISDAIIITNEKEGGETRLVGFVTISEDDIIEDNENHNTAEIGDEAEHVAVWETLFNSDKYLGFEDIQETSIGRDFTSWTSMYDGKLIDTNEMNEWLDDTIRDVLNGGEAGNVLEIGTGTGMMLFNLNKGLKSYVGLEPTEKAISFVHKASTIIPDLSSKIYIQKGTATDIQKLKKLNSPNLVIINSVAQYFPSQDYLYKVIEQILQLDGVETVYMGDVRSQALYREFQVTKALHDLDQNATRDDILRHMEKTAQAEQELLIDPGFFTALPDRFPGLVEHVEIFPKKMEAINELSCYRYAAVLHTRSQVQKRQVQQLPPDKDWVDFQAEGLNRTSLHDKLQDHLSSSEPILITNIPYRYTMLEKLILDDIENNSKGTMAGFHEKARDSCPLSATDLHELAAQTGYKVELSWARQYSQRGGLDAVFHRYRSEPSNCRTLFNFPTDHEGRAHHTFTSQPLRQRLKQRLEFQLLETLRSQLPSYMVPETVMVLEKMPVNANGKVDRRALSKSIPKLSLIRSEQDQIYQPSSSIERHLQQVWSGVLYMSPASIGAEDNFFLLGGDSIAAMKAVSRARKMGINITVADIFRHPTLAAQARVCENQSTSGQEGHPASDEMDDTTPFSLLEATEYIPDLKSELAALIGTQPTQIEDAYPCTPLQEGLMSLTAKRDGSYVRQTYLELSHDVDITLLRAAWEEVHSSTPILRTRIVSHPRHGLTQVVCGGDIEWAESDDLQDHLNHDAAKRMGLGDALSRYGVVKDSNNNPKYLTWTVHHALYDGWSHNLILGLVSRAYHGQKNSSRAPGFSSFVKSLPNANDASIEGYWQRYLENGNFVVFPSLPPTIREPVADETLSFNIPTMVKKQFTMATLVRASLALVLYQFQNSSDVIFGAVVSGRNAAVRGIDEIVGPTIATVPVRINVDQKQTVQELLESVSREATDMIAYEQTGLQRIAKIGEVGKAACAFQTLLVVQPNEDESSRSASDLLGTWETTSKKEAFSTYAITIQCLLGQNDTTIRADFDSRVVGPWLMNRILSQIGNMIDQLVKSSPQHRLGQLNVLTGDDKALLWQWNQTRPSAVERCIHDVVAERARVTPDAPAVEAWNGNLKYSELDALATQLAQHLVSLGASAETVIPICSERSIWTPVSMIAVLKSGAAFVLFDPSIPDTRLGKLCRRLGSNIALASASCEPIISRFVPNTVVVNPGLFQRLQSHSHVLELPLCSASNAAYVIFTSGSTGEPKGVIVEHRSYCSVALNHGAVLTMSQKTRALQFGSYYFAGAIIEHLYTLLFGGCICIPSDDERASNLPGAIRRLDANWAFLTSTTLANMSPEDVPSLKTVCVGGEAIRSAQIKEWGPKIHLRQTYGSAEVSAIISSSRLNAFSSATGDVGEATAGRYWIVNPNNHNQLAPVGAPGEVIVEGPTVGRKYLDDPDRSAQVFISAPSWRTGFGSIEPGSRFYKMGDLASYKEGGAIELIGRKDSQIKLRGQRIEVGEIEYQARSATPDVIDVAVELISTNSQGLHHPQLMGFLVVKNEGDGPGVGQLDILGTSVGKQTIAAIQAVQTRLEDSLPQYMVPSVLVPLAALPLTTSGKTSRKGLREIGARLTTEQLAKLRELLKEQETSKAPLTTTERQLQHLWGNVLGIDPNTIGLGDNFFRLGGDSIIAMRLLVEARKMGLEIAMVDVFRHNSLASLARCQSLKGVSPKMDIQPITLIDPDTKRALCNEIDAMNINIDSRAIQEILPLTTFQEQCVVNGVRHGGQFCQYIWLHVGFSLDVPRFKKGCDDILDRYPILRARFLPVTNTYYQVIPYHLDLPFREIEVEKGLEEAFGSFCQEDMDKFNPTDAPIAFTLLKHPIEGTRFVLRISHAQYDGFSLPHIFQSLIASYNHSEPQTRPDFSDFLSYAAHKKEASTSYWRELLDGSTMTKLGQSFHPQHIDINSPEARITAQKVTALPQLSDNITHASFVGACWAVLLSQITGQNDVVYTYLAAGRNSAIDGIEEIIGPCLNFIPVRANISAHSTAASLLRFIQEQSLALGEADSMDFGAIVKNCTGWGSETTLDSVIQFQNINEHPAFSLEDVESQIQFFENPNFIPPLTRSIHVAFYPVGDKLKMSLTSNSRILDGELADALLERLCKIINLMAATTVKPIHIISSASPNADQATQDSVAMIEEKSVTSNSTSTVAYSTVTVSNIDPCDPDSDCPDCGLLLHASEKYWMNDQGNHTNTCHILH
jgi:amino acid adenylation domain-containing protein